MNTKLKKLIVFFEKNTTQIYLILANLILVIFGIWFSNVGLLPFVSSSDFFVFFILAVVLAIYRPSWTFAFFIGTLALENINLAPKNLGIAIRPYQFFGLITIISLGIRILANRLHFSLPKWKWFDLLPIIFVVSGFLSSFGALNKTTSIKQSIIVCSFVALYFLVRIYVQTIEDLKRIMPFFLSSAFVVVCYSIWQNIRFLHGANSFEVMPGRPNGTFTEPDWFGIYLTFVISIVFAIIYYFHKKEEGLLAKTKLTALYFVLMLIFLVLILTVSRSAWLGAAAIASLFLGLILFNGSLKISQWQWKKFLANIVCILLSVALAAFFASFLTRFQISNRAASTSGLQSITISCLPGLHSGISNGNKISSLDELNKYGCRHINLEDIATEKAQGNDVLTVLRPDPTVNIRSEIYQKSFSQIKAHPILGIGWGNISQILGTDERGAGLNASNIFLEIYLGAGILGLLAFAALLGWILFKGVVWYFYQKNNASVEVFILLGWVAIVFPNLFNSGIFLGFLWFYLAAAISLLTLKK